MVYMKTSRGFTVIELLFVIVVLVSASVIFFVQKNNIEVSARDDQRKTAINAMHYGLEEVYYKQNQNYPRVLDENALPFIDPALFVDPFGVKINQTSIGEGENKQSVTSSYIYEGTNCVESACKSYILKATLESEDDFIKESRNQ